MEVDAEEEEFDWAMHKYCWKNREITQELACQEPLIFEEESVTLHHMDFNKESKKLLIEKINLKNKKVVEKWNSEIDLQGVKPSKVMQFHEATREALKSSINEIEIENQILKEKIRELENALLLKPLFVEPIATIQPLNTLEDIPEYSSRIRGASKLLITIRQYIGENIKKRISLIFEIWELGTSSTILSSRITNFKEYLQKDLDNDEKFYQEVVGTFSTKISNMNDMQRREQNLPSKIRLRQINVGWLKMIECLK
jgi:hypothetical protein